jgi:hypothetical protein
MTTRSVTIAATVGLLGLAATMPQQASALPGAGTDAQVRPAVVQQIGHKYYRHYDPNTGTYVRAPFTEVDTHRGTWVAAPFARVYSGRHGTWVRAPFVNLWVPR